MPACHAGGHEFESRTYREKQPETGCFLRFCYTKSSIRIVHSLLRYQCLKSSKPNLQPMERLCLPLLTKKPTETTREVKP